MNLIVRELKWKESISAYEYQSINTQIMEMPQIAIRNDGAIASGTMKLVNRDKYPIKPYTPLEISTGQGSLTIYYVMSSQVTKYMPKEDVYIHDVQLLGAEAILSNVLIGSKAFSTRGTNSRDSDKIDILLSLANDENTGYTFVFEDTADFGKEIEYTFGAGTTLLDALQEIMKHYDRTLTVGEITEKKEVKIGARKNNMYEEYKPKLITSVTMNQNPENYCNKIVIEGQQVVDRTTPTIIEDLTCRAYSSTYKLSADNCALTLPTPIEELKKLCINEILTMNIVLTGTKDALYDALYSVLIDLGGQLSDLSSPGEVAIYNANSITTDQIIDELNSRGLIKGTDPITKAVEALGYKGIKIGSGGDFGGLKLQNNKWTFSTIARINQLDITSRVLEAEQWNALTAEKKVEYAYYISGGNKIEGLYTWYKDDFWNTLLGQNNGPWLSTILSGKSTEGSSSAVVIENETKTICNFEITAETKLKTDNPLETTFKVEYIAMTTPVISQKKTITDVEGVEFDNYSRSYGINAKTIDYDKLTDNLDKVCNSLGDVELTLECRGEDLPLPGEYVTYDDTKFYITSQAIQFYKTAPPTIVLNCSRTATKVAEALGVDSQYESVPNEQNQIIDRSLYFENNYATIDTEASYYLALQRPDGEWLFKPLALMANGTTAILYARADDQYSFMNTCVKSGSYYYEKNTPYVDQEQEMKNLNVKIVTLAGVTLESSYKLPLIDTRLIKTEVAAFDKTIYKDARECLTFTFKFSKLI